MRKIQSIIAVLLAVIMVFSAVSCTNNQNPAETSAEETTPNVESTPTSESTPESTPDSTVNPEVKTYNVIFALATIPPVLSALEAIQNGYPTYVIIERGKT